MRSMCEEPRFAGSRVRGSQPVARKSDSDSRLAIGIRDRDQGFGIRDKGLGIVSMCGIAGFADSSLSSSFPSELTRSTVQAMCDVIRHRGPDDEGVHVETGVGLGMRRLSIIDLSTGHQPIHNEDETIWLVFNGEIYNYRELRQQLEAAGHRFCTASDTETIVHAY